MQSSRTKNKNFHYFSYPIIFFIKKYRTRSIFLFLGLSISGVLEGLGVAALLPLISLSMGKNIVLDSQFSKYVMSAFTHLGLPFTLPVVLVFLVTVVLLKSLIIYLSMYFVSNTFNRIVAELRTEFINLIFHARWDYFSRAHAGRLSNAISLETEKATNVYLASGKFFTNFAQVVVYIVMAIMIKPFITMVALVAGLIFSIALRGFFRRSNVASQKEVLHSKNISNLFLDYLRGIKTIKSMNKEKSVVKIIDVEIDAYRDAKNRLAQSSNFLNNSQEPMQIIAVCVGFYVATYFLKMKLEEIIILSFVFHRTLQKVSNMQIFLQNIWTSIPSFWYCQEVQQELSNVKENFDESKLADIESKIIFQNIEFSYGPTQILKGLDLEIKKGKFISIVGPSGVGKSTFLDLLLGLNLPSTGKILIDGQEKKLASLKAWKERIGYVPQEPFLFHDSIKANLSLGENYSDEQLWESLKAAEISSFVSSLELGLEHNVGENGGALSGGQKQRIAIARALLRSPQLLILDEATSALDPKAEAEIINALSGLKGKITVISVTHKASFNEIADEVYELKNLKFEKTK